MTYQTRLHHLQALLKHSQCDALLLEDKISLYYLTGLNLSAGRLLVHSQGAELFVDSRYFESAQKICPFNVWSSEKFPLEILLSMPQVASIQALAFDSQASYKAFLQLETAVKKIQRATPISLVPLDAPLKLLRSIKEPAEIDLLRAAAKLGSQGYDFVCKLLREGISEEEVATELEVFWKRQGSKGVAFEPIIAFGINSSMPHYRAGKSQLKAGDIALIDIGVNLQHYHSDMTRIAFLGKPPGKLFDIYKIVAEAQQTALALCKPGNTLGLLDKTARDVISKAGYGDNFTHSLGHGVGLEIHEYPTIKNAPPFDTIELTPGMVITIEPGIYLPALGGVRIEDTVVITKEGHENLTQRSIDPYII